MVTDAMQASKRYKQPVFICHHDAYEPQETSSCQNNLRGVADPGSNQELSNFKVNSTKWKLCLVLGN